MIFRQIRFYIKPVGFDSATRPCAARTRLLRNIMNTVPYLHATLEEWYEGLKGWREGGVEYVLSLHVGLAHCPRVQAEQRAVPSHLQQKKLIFFGLNTSSKLVSAMLTKGIK
jgi:hypothetical protein